jgi:mRNA-degrading endonuclease RelE of RelBE toxin-antitoxin system
MNFEMSRKFEKQVYQIKDKSVKRRLSAIITKISKANSLSEISNIKPITGYPGYYRIKFGDYRIGISHEGDVVWLLFFGKRDESTYKKFP